MTQTNHYCVPMALSILTGIPVEGVEEVLKDKYLGDVEISGIYIGLALKFLSDNGYEWLTEDLEGHRLQAVKWPTKYKENITYSYLVEIPGHALVIHECKVYDNSYPNGTHFANYERRAERIVRAYRITRNA